MRSQRVTLCVVVCAAASNTAQSRPAVFDFESFSAASPFTAPGNYTALADSDSGVNLALSRSSGARFDITLAGGAFFPTTWGQNILSPFHSTIPPNTPPFVNDVFVANLTGAAGYGASIEFGDFGQGADAMYFEVWSGANGSGTLLYSDVEIWTGNFQFGSPADSFSYLGSTAIGSVLFWGGENGFPNSMYWDNLVIDLNPLVPLPSAAGLALAGFAIVSSRRRR